MSAAPLSAHGFQPTRGRGYRPEQVDQQVAALSQDRDNGWERAARLTVLAKQMEAEAAQLREQVASLAPQTYETLSPRAQQILGLAAEEAQRVLAEAREESQAEGDAAEAAARQTGEAAREEAEAVMAEADEYAVRVLTAARSAEDEERMGARRDVKAERGEALAGLKEMRRRTQSVMDSLEKGHGERLASAEREFAQRRAALDTGHDELTAYAMAGLEEAKRTFSEAGEQARHGQEDAQAQAAELLAQAAALSERLARDTERLVREHTEAREEMNAHMTHVREGLASLTGRAAAAEG
jgi:cell division septum initiation protein DivIVA